MAQRVQIILEDDYDGGEADETVSFALDGAEYEIDLSTANATELRNALGSVVVPCPQGRWPSALSRRLPPRRRPRTAPVPPAISAPGLSTMAWRFPAAAGSPPRCGRRTSRLTPDPRRFPAGSLRPGRTVDRPGRAAVSSRWVDRTRRSRVAARKDSSPDQQRRASAGARAARAEAVTDTYRAARRSVAEPRSPPARSWRDRSRGLELWPAGAAPREGSPPQAPPTRRSHV